MQPSNNGFASKIKELLNGIDVGWSDSSRYEHPYLCYEMTEKELVEGLWDDWYLNLHKKMFDISYYDLDEVIDTIRNPALLQLGNIDLPLIIPILPLETLGPSIRNLLELMDTDAAVIPFYELYDGLRINGETWLYDWLLRRGVRESLHFDGQLLLSSIAPDEALVNEGFMTRMVQFYNEGEFNALIGYDYANYIDWPSFAVWVNLAIGLYWTYQMSREGATVIPLLKGHADTGHSNVVSSPAVFCISALERMGYDSIAVHLSEVLRLSDNELEESDTASFIQGYDEIISSRVRGKSLLLGAGSIQTLKRVVSPQLLGRSWRARKLLFAGIGWFRDAQHGRIYVPGENEDGITWVHALDKDVYCECKACKKSRGDPLLRIAAHNFNTLRNYAEMLAR